MLEPCHALVQACFRRCGVGPECHPRMAGAGGTAMMRMTAAEVADAEADTEALTGRAIAATAVIEPKAWIT